MIRSFIERAKLGESVYICDVRDAFSSVDTAVGCIIETATGEINSWTIPLPKTADKQEEDFVRDYFYANIYNIISTYGGKHMTFYVDPGDDFIEQLCNTLDVVFQVGLSRADRFGYGKCLNVTDRVNAAFGHKPFHFVIKHGKSDVDIHNEGPQEDAISAFRNAVSSANNAVLIGLDIGGSDIKAVGSVDGHIISLKEFDWDPSSMTRIEQIIDGITNVVEEICSELGESVKPDGIGVGFPDVVIENKIVGGETLKTRSIRLASPDYETEFARLFELDDVLRGYCKPGGIVNMTNDGNLAAFTAAVELACSSRADETKAGVLAHTLGTEFGTGWIDENGDIPQIPLEIYNGIIDMGNFTAREFEPFDLRSMLNFNTGIPGTLQKYASQTGAYRLAVEYFKEDAEEIYNELCNMGFIEEKNGGIYVVLSPSDMRKPLLSYIMKLADEGQPQAEQVFKVIGKYLAATWRETEFLLRPKTKRRILYGRFVKSQRCLKLMQDGACEMIDIALEAGDDDLANTPLMQELKNNPDYTVAQFGQAIGAVHFAAKNRC